MTYERVPVTLTDQTNLEKSFKTNNRNNHVALKGEKKKNVDFYNELSACKPLDAGDARKLLFSIIYVC